MGAAKCNVGVWSLGGGGGDEALELRRVPAHGWPERSIFVCKLRHGAHANGASAPFWSTLGYRSSASASVHSERGALCLDRRARARALCAHRPLGRGNCVLRAYRPRSCRESRRALWGASRARSLDRRECTSLLRKTSAALPGENWLLAVTRRTWKLTLCSCPLPSLSFSPPPPLPFSHPPPASFPQLQPPADVHPADDPGRVRRVPLRVVDCPRTTRTPRTAFHEYTFLPNSCLFCSFSFSFSFPFFFCLRWRTFAFGLRFRISDLLDFGLLGFWMWDFWMWDFWLLELCACARVGGCPILLGPRS